MILSILFTNAIKQIDDVLKSFGASWDLTIQDKQGNEWLITSKAPFAVKQTKTTEQITIKVKENVEHEEPPLSLEPVSTDDSV
jgi:hypothetical protein